MATPTKESSPAPKSSPKNEGPEQESPRKEVTRGTSERKSSTEEVTGDTSLQTGESDDSPKPDSRESKVEPEIDKKPDKIPDTSVTTDGDRKPKRKLSKDDPDPNEPKRQKKLTLEEVLDMGTDEERVQRLSREMKQNAQNCQTIIGESYANLEKADIERKAEDGEPHKLLLHCEIFKKTMGKVERRESHCKCKVRCTVSNGCKVALIAWGEFVYCQSRSTGKGEEAH